MTVKSVLKTSGRVLLRLLAVYVISVVLFDVGMRVATTVYRHRCERLMADFQSLELYKTPWPEAQRLMTKWGRYGHDEGTCDAGFCRYRVKLSTPLYASWRDWPGPAKLKALQALAWTLRPYNIALGSYVSRDSEFLADFVVQDGIVFRKNVGIVVNDPPLRRGGYAYSLIAFSSAFSRVTTGHLIYDDPARSDALAEHPLYAAGRPGGCMNCMEASVAFSPHAPASQIRALTTFNLRCIDRLRPCESLEELFPAAKPWHFYDLDSWKNPDRPYVQEPQPPPMPLACRVPLWVLGREAHTIIAADSLHEQQTYEKVPWGNDKVLTEHATVRVTNVLKRTNLLLWNASRRDRGPFKPPVVGDELQTSVAVSNEYTPLAIETPLSRGEHFLILIFANDFYQNRLNTGRCRVIPDTSENRAQLMRGAALNDQPRIPNSIDWPYYEE